MLAIRSRERSQIKAAARISRRFSARTASNIAKKFQTTLTDSILLVKRAILEKKKKTKEINLDNYNLYIF